MRPLTVLPLFASLLCAGEFLVGTTLPEAILSDHGKAVTIRPAAGKVMALIFVSTNCPVSNAYNERIKQLHSDYAGKPVQFVFVNANHGESATDADAHAKTHGWDFKVYKDEGKQLADKLNAQVTPEVYLFDQAGVLAYHGRIDDARDIAKVKTKDARAALNALLAGTAVPTAETKAFGCTISRVRKAL